MMYMITGVNGSGKSEYAENLAMELAESGPLYYIATMQPYGEEGQRRIERHHKLRAGKGFQTIEQYVNIGEILLQMERKEQATVLLECMSNLLANEMFCDERNNDAVESVRDRILLQIEQIRQQVKHLIIVTNEVFADGVVYPMETEQYRAVLAAINRELVLQADEAVEIVYSIPVWMK